MEQYRYILLNNNTKEPTILPCHRQRDSIEHERIFSSLFLAKESFKTALHSTSYHCPAATRTKPIHLLMVTAAQLIEILELLFRHSIVVIPTVATHEGALLLLHPIQRVTMEILERSVQYLVHKTLILVDKPYNLIGLLAIYNGSEEEQA